MRRVGELISIFVYHIYLHVNSRQKIPYIKTSIKIYINIRLISKS